MASPRSPAPFQASTSSPTSLRRSLAVASTVVQVGSPRAPPTRSPLAPSPAAPGAAIADALATALSGSGSGSTGSAGSGSTRRATCEVEESWGRMDSPRMGAAC